MESNFEGINKSGDKMELRNILKLRDQSRILDQKELQTSNVTSKIPATLDEHHISEIKSNFRDTDTEQLQRYMKFRESQK